MQTTGDLGEICLSVAKCRCIWEFYRSLFTVISALAGYYISTFYKGLFCPGILTFMTMSKVLCDSEDCLQ